MTSDDQTATSSALTAKRVAADAVLGHIEHGADLIIGVANGEPKTVIDAIEAGAAALSDVRIHQMFPLRAGRRGRGQRPPAGASRASYVGRWNTSATATPQRAGRRRYRSSKTAAERPPFSNPDS